MDNPTVTLILSRLRDTPLVTPRELADAFGFVTAAPIYDAIDTGAIRAVRVCKTVFIAQAEARRFVESTSTDPAAKQLAAKPKEGK